MSSILSSQGIVLATAMAVSGTVILLVLRLQKSPSPILSLPPSSIISSGVSARADDVKEKEKKRKKRVHFAEDVVDPPPGNSEDYRKLRSNNNNTWGDADSSPGNIKYSKSKSALKKGGRRVGQEMPANRVALYNGILRDRVHKKRSSY